MFLVRRRRLIRFGPAAPAVRLLQLCSLPGVRGCASMFSVRGESQTNLSTGASAGTPVMGRVTRVTPDGAFVRFRKESRGKVGANAEGFVHWVDMTGPLEVGDERVVFVLSEDKEGTNGAQKR